MARKKLKFKMAKKLKFKMAIWSPWAVLALDERQMPGRQKRFTKGKAAEWHGLHVTGDHAQRIGRFKRPRTYEEISPKLRNRLVESSLGVQKEFYHLAFNEWDDHGVRSGLSFETYMNLILGLYDDFMIKVALPLDKKLSIQSFYDVIKKGVGSFTLRCVSSGLIRELTSFPIQIFHSILLDVNPQTHKITPSTSEKVLQYFGDDSPSPPILDWNAWVTIGNESLDHFKYRISEKLLVFELTEMGYGFFDVELDEIEVRQSCVDDPTSFTKLVKLVNFLPSFDTGSTPQTEEELRELRGFIDQCLDYHSRWNLTLGVAENFLPIFQNIRELPRLNCLVTLNLISNGIQRHFDVQLENFKPADWKTDIVIDHVSNLDRNVHAILVERDALQIPELASVVDGNYLYAILDSLTFNVENLQRETFNVENLQREMMDAAKKSKGCNLSETMVTEIENLAQRVMGFTVCNEVDYNDLLTKMNDIAPNLTALVGVVVGARMISKAGSLRILAKNTLFALQNLGDVDDVFSSLATPGIIVKHDFIFRALGCASHEKKVHLTQYLAGQCSIVSRHDYFKGTHTVGETIHKQVKKMLEDFKKEDDGDGSAKKKQRIF